MQIGGNDLAHDEEPGKLARDIASFADYVITVYDVSHVIVGQLLPRHFESSGLKYNDKVNKVNQHLASMLKNLKNITFWKHRALWRGTVSLLLPDKVHLNDVGMQVYAKSVRAAVENHALMNI